MKKLEVVRASSNSYASSMLYKLPACIRTRRCSHDSIHLLVLPTVFIKDLGEKGCGLFSYINNMLESSKQVLKPLITRFSRV